MYSLDDTVLGRTESKKLKEREENKHTEESGLSSVQKAFAIAPLKAVHQSAKARFIIRPDALRVKEQ